MRLVLRAVAASDIGLVRGNNEDAVYVGRRLLVVADGMGGLPAGEVASDILVRTLAEVDSDADSEDAADTDTDSADADSAETESADSGDSLRELRDAVALANERIDRAVAEDAAERTGMGTTVTAVLLAGERLALLNVGDSRCYRSRDGQLTQLTRDDTYVQVLVDQGMLSAAEARRHPQRALVTQAVQGGDLTPVGRVMTPRAGDRLLLCSDGLSDYVDDEVIAVTLRAYPDRALCATELIARTLEAGAPDNVTVIVADLEWERTAG